MIVRDYYRGSLRYTESTKELTDLVLSIVFPLPPAPDSRSPIAPAEIIIWRGSLFVARLNYATAKFIISNYIYVIQFDSSAHLFPLLYTFNN